MPIRLHFYVFAFLIISNTVDGNSMADVRWNSKKSQIVHHSLDNSRKHSQQEPGWLSVEDSCSESLEIPKVLQLLQLL